MNISQNINIVHCVREIKR